jgi:hypothetical protein
MEMKKKKSVNKYLNATNAELARYSHLYKISETRYTMHAKKEDQISPEPIGTIYRKVDGNWVFIVTDNKANCFWSMFDLLIVAYRLYQLNYKGKENGQDRTEG